MEQAVISPWRHLVYSVVWMEADFSCKTHFYFAIWIKIKEPTGTMESDLSSLDLRLYVLIPTHVSRRYMVVDM